MALKNKVLVLVFVVVCGTFSLLVCPLSLADQPPSVPLKIGFLYVGPKNDYGWHYAQEIARLDLESKLKGKVQTMVAENIPEDAQAERVMERMIAQGCKLIFAPSYGYLEPVERVAARHADVKFMQLSRFVDKPNIASYFYLQYQAMYVAGVVAGRMTKNNKLGFVAAHPVPPLLQSINAYMLGIRSVNPKARLKVVWTNKWVDPATETEAAKGLIDSGIDVLAFDQSAPLAIVKTAESNKTPVVGCYTDDHQFAPKYWLTGCKFNWSPYYTQVAQSVIENKWRPGITICDMSTNGIQLSSFGPLVPNRIQVEALALADKIKSSKIVVFEGPIIDSTGKIRLPAGRKPDINWLAKMNFFVPGIDGSLPLK